MEGTVAWKEQRNGGNDGSNSSCNSLVAPTGLPGPSRAYCCDRSNDFLVTCRTHPSPTRLQGTSLRQVFCRNSASFRKLCGNPSGTRLTGQFPAPCPSSASGHHCWLPDNHLLHPLGRLLRLPAIHRERRCATEGPAEGASVPDGPFLVPSETPGGFPSLSDCCWCSR